MLRWRRRIRKVLNRPEELVCPPLKSIGLFRKVGIMAVGRGDAPQRMPQADLDDVRLDPYPFHVGCHRPTEVMDNPMFKWCA